MGLLGGAIADAVDRRRLVLGTSTLLALLSVVLFGQAALHLDAVWLLYAVVAAQAAVFAVDSPARRTFPPRLLPAGQLPAANALNQLGVNLSTFGGPLLAGVLIAGIGLPAAYGLDALSFAAALYAVARLAPMRPDGGGAVAGLAAISQGLRFLAGRPVLLMTFLVDINAMIFGMPRALFPALAEGRFHGGPATVGLLYSAISLGGFLAAVLGGWIGRVRWQGRATLVAITLWGAAIVAFGLTDRLPVAVAMLAVAGAADMVSAVYRSTILRVATPDSMRGRLAGVFIVVVAGGPRLGDLEAGAVAAAVSPAFSVVSGGLACIVGVLLLAALVPSFRRYDAVAATAGPVGPVG